MINLTLLASHSVFFVIAAFVCRTNASIRDNTLILALGVVAVPVFGALMLVLLDFRNHAGNGTTGAWYLIFSVVTLGGVPIVTHFCAAISGVCGYAGWRYFRGRGSNSSVT